MLDSLKRGEEEATEHKIGGFIYMYKKTKSCIVIDDALLVLE